MRPWLGWIVAALVVVGCGDEFTSGGGGAGGTATGAGTATGTATGTAGGGATGGGGGGTTGAEHCLDGLDNDDDGAIDCADEDCSPAYRCVPPIPAGWIGIGWVDPTQPASDVPCPPDSPGVRDLYDEDDLQAPQADCPCSCGEPQDVDCEAALTCYTAAGDCDGGSTTPAVSEVIGESCSNLSGSGNALATCSAGDLTAANGSCVPHGESVKDAYDWPPSGRLCFQNQPGECVGGDVCVPAPPPEAFGPCVFKPGDDPCPSGYPERSTFFDGLAEDNRGCQTCQCDPPTGVACLCTGVSCGVDLQTGTNCPGTNLATVPYGADCHQLSIPIAVNYSARIGGTISTSGGSCVPTDPQPIGAVVPVGKYTVCCVAPAGGG